MSRSRDTADQINIIDSSAADATAITIDSSENVGIGTTSPNAVLTTDPESGNFSSTYNNYDGVGLFIRGNGTSGNGNYGPALVFGSCDSDTVNQDHKHAAISIVQTDTDPNQTGLAFWTHPSATAADALVNSMRITSAGNVGIGDSSPSRVLSTKSSSVTVGSFESTSASGGLISFVDQNTTNDVTVRVGALGNDLVLQAGGSERLRIDSSGTATFDTSVSSQNNNVLVVKSAYPSANTTTMYMEADGDIATRSGSYGTISDQRLKQQITPANSQWDDVKAAVVKKYKFNADVDAFADDAPEQIGWVAQELEAAGLNGVVKDGQDGFKSVKTTVLMIKAFKALQEAMDRIETLEARIATMG